MAALTCALAIGLMSAPAFAAVQTVTSTEGRYAWGLGGAKVSESSELWFHAYFARQEGVKAGGPATGSADLNEPIGSIELTEYRRVAGAPGYYHTETIPLCNTAQNVSSYDVGRRTNTGGWKRDEPVWTGAWYDVDCDGALGYDFFRVHIDAAYPWSLFEAASADIQTPVSAERDEAYGLAVSEEQAQSVTYDWVKPYWEILTGKEAPEFTPVSIPRVKGPSVQSDAAQMHTAWTVHSTWNAGYGYDPATAGWIGWFGHVTGQPMQRQIAFLRLCGHRDGQEVDCFAGGFGDIFPSVLGMTQVLHSPDAK